MFRSLLFFLLLLSSPVFGMKSLFSSDEDKAIVKKLCDDLGCSQRDILNEVYRLRIAKGELDQLNRNQVDFEKRCAEIEAIAIPSGSEKASDLLADSKTKCLEMEREAKSRKDLLENDVKELESKLFYLERAESRLNELLKVSEDKDSVVACTRDDTKAIFRRSDFERDARFLSCGLYPFLFSENFKGIERSDGARELRDLNGRDLKFLAEGMEHPDYKIAGFKSLDKKMQGVFNSRLDYYCLTCKNGRLGVLGMEPERGSGWSDVKDEEVGDKTFTYYMITLNGVDFEFVSVLSGEDGEDFMMSHWVTQRQWKAVMGENPAHFAGRGLDLPMENVSYNDIVNNFLPRLNGLLQDAGFEGSFQLPSAAQWQRMADKNVAADFKSNKSKYSDFGKAYGSGQPLQLKFKERGNLGAWMFGGVWEWVARPNASGDVALRGGSWYSYSVKVGPSARNSNRSDYRDRTFGLRLLRTFPGQA